MARVKSISIPEGKEELWKKFEEIAKREKGTWGTSEMVLDALEEYVKTHGSGNPAYSLDHFKSADAVAWPSPWSKAIGFSELEPFCWKEEDEMIRRLEKTLETVKIDRQKKRDAEMRAKGLIPRVKGS